MGNIIPKIIGNGTIAKAFSESGFSREVVVFASGVSNSREVRHREFQREKELLECVVEENPHTEIIYFSSTSVIFKESNYYSEHKKAMEELLVSKGNKYYIFRLPQVVGVVLNNTLVSYLIRSCLESNRLDVHEYAVRNLIDVEDLVRIVQSIVNRRLGLCSIETLASASNVPVPDLVIEISELLMMPFEIRSIPDGDDQTVSISFLQKNLHDYDPILNNDYWKTVLTKYVPLLKKRISGE